MREKDASRCVFSGAGVKKFFSNEVGGHTFSRIPPTESKGRVHTSSVTVAVMEPGQQNKIELKDSDIEVRTTNGTGPGGQNRNRTYSCVVLKHISTGIVVRCDEDRSQLKNKEIALKELTKRVQDLYDSEKYQKETDKRRNQIGSGSRGEKRRTYTFKSDLIVDHISGKRASLKQVFKGNLKLLHI
jgi:peptide chain release factor 1